MIAQTSLIALNDSKRYHGKLKQKNNDQKQEDEQVNKKIASFVWYPMKAFEADKEHDWNKMLKWIKDKEQLEKLATTNPNDTDTDKDDNFTINSIDRPKKKKKTENNALNDSNKSNNNNNKTTKED